MASLLISGRKVTEKIYLAAAAAILALAGGNEAGAAYLCADVGAAAPKRAAERFIRADLKNPSGAKFSGVGETRVAEISRCRFAVFGWVDATNGFGAVIRRDYGAIVIYQQSQRDWLLEGWKFDP